MTRTNKQTITISFFDHQEQDFSPVYKRLFEKYESDIDNMPAVLLLDNVSPMIIQNQYGDSCVILDRNSKRLVEDLDAILLKPITKVDNNYIRDLRKFWCPGDVYYVWYTWLMEICTYLQIKAPALFVCYFMPDPLSNLGGAVLPGGEEPYVSDIFLKSSDNIEMMLKVLLHELRHVWQHKNHNAWFEGYFSYTPDNAEKYYFQKPEMEADAFAYWVLSKNGINFILEDLGEERSKVLREYMAKFDADNTPQLKLSYIEKKRKH